MAVDAQLLGVPRKYQVSLPELVEPAELLEVVVAVEVPPQVAQGTPTFAPT